MAALSGTRRGLTACSPLRPGAPLYGAAWTQLARDVRRCRLHGPCQRSGLATTTALRLCDEPCGDSQAAVLPGDHGDAKYGHRPTVALRLYLTPMKKPAARCRATGEGVQSQEAG